MRRSLRFAIATALLAGLVLGAGTVSAAKGGNHKILDVQLVGLAVPHTVIAGVAGAGHAWAIDEGNAKLFSDGRLLINVEGLVLTPEGTNPVPARQGRRLVQRWRDGSRHRCVRRRALVRSPTVTPTSTSGSPCRARAWTR